MERVMAVVKNTLMRKLSNHEFDSPAKVRDTDWEAVPASLVARHV